MPARSYTNVVFVLCLGLVPNGHGAAQSVSASQETLRIERLETLADVWGKLWLFHPNIVTSDVDWESILVRTIPEVERAQTIDQLLDVLNRSLFAPLGDPTLVAQKTFPFDNGDRSPLSERKLTGRVGYIDATDPREQKTKDFAQRFLSLVSELGGYRDPRCRSPLSLRSRGTPGRAHLQPREYPLAGTLHRPGAPGRPLCPPEAPRLARRRAPFGVLRILGSRRVVE